MFPHRFFAGRHYAPRYWPPRRSDRITARPRVVLCLYGLSEIIVPLTEPRTVCLLLAGADRLLVALRADQTRNVILSAAAAPALELCFAVELTIALRE